LRTSLTYRVTPSKQLRMETEEDTIIASYISSDPSSTPQVLFQAVANRDYGALIHLYANHARISLLHFLQMKRRWNAIATPHHRHHQNNNVASYIYTNTTHEFGAGTYWVKRFEQLEALHGYIVQL
jgi:hypothetical protein